MLDMSNLYTITIKSSNIENIPPIQTNNKYDTLAAAIATALTMETDTYIPGFLIEDFCERITKTLKRWEKELQNPEELLEKHTNKLLNSQNLSK